VGGLIRDGRGWKEGEKGGSEREGGGKMGGREWRRMWVGPGGGLGVERKDANTWGEIGSK